MVLVYLLLSKDLERFAAAQDHILHPNELADAALTVRWVLDAVQYRVDDLRGTLYRCFTTLKLQSHCLADIFKQRALDVDTQFKMHACGIVSSVAFPLCVLS